MNSISSMLKFPFLNRRLEEQFRIKQLGRPIPLLKLTNHHVLKCSDLYEKYDWICGCEYRNAFFCFPCILFGREDSWSLTGCRDPVNLFEMISTHEVDEIHIHNVINLAFIGKKALLESKRTTMDHNMDIHDNYKTLILMIDTLKYCVKANIPLTKKYCEFEEDEYISDDGFENLLEFVAKSNNLLKNILKKNFFSNSIELKKDLINSALEVYHREVLKEVNEADFLSIIIDEPESYDFHSVLILRYVVNHKPVERIWKLFTYDQTKKSFFEILKKELKILVNCPTKLISESFKILNLIDENEENSIYLSVKEIYKNVQLVNFYCHDLYDILESTANLDLQLEIFFSKIRAICNFFTQEPWSNKAREIFEITLNSTCKEKLKWDFKMDKLKTISNYKEELKKSFDEILMKFLNFPSMAISKALLIQSWIEENNFHYLLEIFIKIFSHFEYYFNEYDNCLKLSDTESSSLLLEYNINRVSDLPSTPFIPFVNSYDSTVVKVQIDEDLQLFETNIEMNYMKMEEVTMPQRASMTDSSRKRKHREGASELNIERFKSISSELQKRFRFRAHIFATQLVDPKNFRQYSTDFPKSFFEIVVDYFPMLHAQRLNIELKVLYERHEYQVLLSICSLLKELVMSKLDSIFQQTVQLLNIVLTIPSKTLEQDCCFSIMDELNNYLKNCKEEELTEHFVCLGCNEKFIQNIDEYNEKVIQGFLEKSGIFHITDENT